MENLSAKMEVCQFGEKNKRQHATIIVAFAGVGKTYCAEKYSNILDLDHLFFKYTYSKELIKSKSFEELKGIQEGRKQNPLWPQNFMQELVKNVSQYDIILVPAGKQILQCLDEANLDYILCYPKVECKAIYIKRYLKRGTNLEWIEKTQKNFEKTIKEYDSREGKKIILSGDETLEDKLIELNEIKGL